MTNNFKLNTDEIREKARRVTSWRDLPQNRESERYQVTHEDGEVSEIVVGKGNRVILDALISGPLVCASPVRISEYVCTLRKDYCVPIGIEMFANDAATGRSKFGVYFLTAKVERISCERLVA